MLQQSLFGDVPAMPMGFVYRENVLSESEERVLLGVVAELPFKEFQFHSGFVGKRRTVSFGWRYDYESNRLTTASDMPDFLFELRQRAAAFAAIAEDRIVQALVTEYDVGAGIGWHVDKPMYEEIIGVSLQSPCTFRLRRKAGEKWERKSLEVAPRSIYLMRGEVRREWEHSIPPVNVRRYSITFRTFAPNS